MRKLVVCCFFSDIVPSYARPAHRQDTLLVDPFSRRSPAQDSAHGPRFAVARCFSSSSRCSISSIAFLLLLGVAPCQENKHRGCIWVSRVSLLWAMTTANSMPWPVTHTFTSGTTRLPSPSHTRAIIPSAQRTCLLALAMPVDGRTTTALGLSVLLALVAWIYSSAPDLPSYIYRPLGNLPPASPAMTVPLDFPAPPPLPKATGKVDLKLPPTEDRPHRYFVLPNGMEVIAVSDPKADKAAASMDVGVGHLSDPDNLAGCAHFCEHLMFMGTKTVGPGCAVLTPVPLRKRVPAVPLCPQRPLERLHRHDVHKLLL